MKIKSIIIITMYILFVCSNVYSQESFAFTQEELEITIFPKAPGLCPNATADVTCLEYFDSYKWEMVNPHPEFEALYGQSQELEYPGAYTLTVEKNINGKICSEVLSFQVYSLQNPEGIASYLTNNGFYTIPIYMNQAGIKDSSQMSDSRNSCYLEEFRFSAAHEYLNLNVENTIEDVANSFKPFASGEYSANVIKTNNNCFCAEGVETLEEMFYSNPFSIWVHVSASFKDDADGVFYIKGWIPFEGEVPVDESQISYMESIHEEIITDSQNNQFPDKASLEHLRVLVSNVLMPHPVGGYDTESQCTFAATDFGDTHVFTPGGQAVQIPTGASEIILENDIAQPYHGCMIKFTEGNKQWQNYYRQEDYMISNGYYNPINAEFFEKFETAISDCQDCILDIASIAQGCDNLSCLLEIYSYSTKYFNILSIKDGGFNYEISPSTRIWSFWPVSKRAAKELIYDLICAMKNGDSTFEYDNKFAGKIIFGKNIVLNDLEYEYVGVTLPKQGNSITLLDEPQLNNNGTVAGFINSFEISPDSEVRLNFLKVDLDVSGLPVELAKVYKSAFKSAYTYPAWDEFVNSITSCIQYYNLTEKYDFLNYLDPEDKQNVLIMVNGYRILGLSPGKKWYKGGVEYPTPDPQDAVNSCYDNYENGSYWGESGVDFAKRINNNVVYVDGHHSITTSNHRLMASDNMTETTFLSSILTCLPLKFFCTNIFCSLNDTPNGAGFFIRYINGFSAGREIWDQMVDGTIHTALTADKSQITGKIDIVAHSMGYAYSKGMIDFLMEKLAPGNTFGNYYIIAPENARGYTEDEFNDYPPEIQDDVVVDLSLFESVFQYGSNFNPNGDPKCKQDGVAPQQRVRGLPDDNSNNVFIPDSEDKIKNFVKAHLMENYGWMFDRKKGDPGYIQKRN